jgi:hypothetical protein
MGLFLPIHLAIGVNKNAKGMAQRLYIPKSLPVKSPHH